MQQDNPRPCKKLSLRIPDAWHKFCARYNARLTSTWRYGDKTLQLLLKLWGIICVNRPDLTSTVTLRTAAMTASVNSSSEKGHCSIFVLTLTTGTFVRQNKQQQMVQTQVGWMLELRVPLSRAFKTIRRHLVLFHVGYLELIPLFNGKEFWTPPLSKQFRI